MAVPQQQKRWRDELAVVLERLDMYYQAERAILSGAQEYRIGSRSLRRGDLQHIQDEIDRLQKRKNELETALTSGADPNRRKTFRVLFRDL